MKHLIKFKGKNYSWDRHLNLLFKERNIYVMDNHLAAVWCWLQEIDLNKRYNILHIDRHYDTRFSHINEWIENITEKLHELSIDDFISLTYEDPNFKQQNKIMNWDNYFPIFHRLYGMNINKFHFITHNLPEMSGLIKKCNLKDFLNSSCIKSNNYKWIVNIDIDYFFKKDHEDYYQFIDDEDIIKIIDEINKAMNNIEVLTIALSPEMCGDWNEAERVMKILANQLKIDWNIL